MKKLLIPFVGLIAVACSGGSDSGSGGAATPPPDKGATASNATGPYAAVDGIFQANCMPCHSAAKHAGGLSLHDFDGLMKGGEDGPAVKAGDPDTSLVVQVLKGPVTTPAIPAMPMKRAPLAAADIQKVADWVKAGAKNS